MRRYGSGHNELRGGREEMESQEELYNSGESYEG
jgi:hypothetical protein